MHIWVQGNYQRFDRLASSTEQHWSLMPLHAVTSTVRPASYQYGGGFGWGGPNRIGFPQYVLLLCDLRVMPEPLMSYQKVVWPEFKARKTQSSTRRYSNTHATQSLRGQVRDQTVVYSCTFPVYRQAVDGKGYCE